MADHNDVQNIEPRTDQTPVDTMGGTQADNKALFDGIRQKQKEGVRALVRELKGEPAPEVQEATPDTAGQSDQVVTGQDDQNVSQTNVGEQGEVQEPAKAQPSPSAEIERLAKGRIRLRWQREEQEAASERRRLDVEARERALAEREKRLSAPVEDPFEYLKSQGYDLSDPKVLKAYLEGGGPAALKKPVDPLEKYKAEQARELEELKQFKKSYEESQKREVGERATRQVRDACAEAVKDQEAYPFLHAEGGSERVYSEMMGAHQEAARQLAAGKITRAQYERLHVEKINPDYVSKWLEDQFEQDYVKKSQLKKAQKLGERKPVEKPAVQQVQKPDQKASGLPGPVPDAKPVLKKGYTREEFDRWNLEMAEWNRKQVLDRHERRYQDSQARQSRMLGDPQADEKKLRRQQQKEQLRGTFEKYLKTI